MICEYNKRVGNNKSRGKLLVAERELNFDQNPPNSAYSARDFFTFLVFDILYTSMCIRCAEEDLNLDRNVCVLFTISSTTNLEDFHSNLTFHNYIP